MADKDTETYYLSRNHCLYLQSAVQDRLTEYGFEPGMYPQKYGAYQAVRKIIRLRLKQEKDIDLPKGNKSYTDDEINQAMAMLDKILPPIGEKEESR